MPIGVHLMRASFDGADVPDRCAHALADAGGVDVSDGRAPDVVVAGAAIKPSPAAPVIVVLDSGNFRVEAARALASGVAGVLDAQDVERTLPVAITAAVNGMTVVSNLSRQVLGRPVLSGREKQILGLLVLGLTNAEIAAKLYLSESTVKHHLLQVYAQLGVKTRKEAADLLLDPSSGLGIGILALTSSGSRSGDTYAAPRVT